ncbi:MAG: hypothetical protein IJY30_04910, partial [Muribaculaceae bacterium]|nr:hypothetical protein [Muribaculaceae bacterium]
MKHIFKYILACLCLMPGMSVYAQGVNHASQLEKYVYPNNIPASPNAYTYMPDGQTFLSLSNDGKTIIKYDLKTGNEIETVLDVNKTRENKISK